jgi:septation ring formation regulator EzrA
MAVHWRMNISDGQVARMTNSGGTGESRLDQIEAILQLTAERAAENSDAIQRNTAAIQQTLDLVQENRQQLQRTMLAVERLANAQIEIARAFDEDRQRFEQFQTRFEQIQASTNAALERIDRIMDYLMRRDGERGVEG